jgi:hypothetical protein
MWPVIGFIAAGFALLSIIHSVRQEVLKRARTGESFETFFRYFSNERVSKKLCLVIYEYLQGWAIRDFPIRPTDNLTEVYGIAMDEPEGFEEVVEDLYEKLRIKVPSNKELALVVEEIGPIYKVEDLVRMFSRLLER